MIFYTNFRLLKCPPNFLTSNPFSKNELTSEIFKCYCCYLYIIWIRSYRIQSNIYIFFFFPTPLFRTLSTILNRSGDGNTLMLLVLKGMVPIMFAVGFRKCLLSRKIFLVFKEFHLNGYWRFLLFLFIFVFNLATPRGTWDLSSLIRDQTCAPWSGSLECLNH